MGLAERVYPEESSLARSAVRAVLLVVVLWIPAERLPAATCSVAQHTAPTEADKALLAADYAKAATLYRAGLTGHPGDVELTIGLVHALLRQQKVQEAAYAVKASLANTPKSAALITLRGEVEYRAGTPWAATQSVIDSDKLDVCNARNHLLLADLARLNSMYASSRKQLEIAHKLDPDDPQIRGQWIRTLPLKQRIAETEAYLAEPRGLDEEDTRRWKLFLENQKKLAAEPHKACHLVSPTTFTVIPFASIMRDAVHRAAFGLDVKLNGRNARLEIDTGADGLIVTRSVAQHAGLKPFSETEMSGVGDQGYKPGYNAYADTIHIGNLEFQDCALRVLDSRSTLDVDGLIGMDVFSQFLVTLDYPMRKLLLGPLPPRPDEAAATAPSLKTNDGERDDTDANAKAAAQNAAVAANTNGPHDRYIAPEMKDYLPIYRVGHMLIQPATLSGNIPKLFILDTGAMTTTISPEAAREVTKIHADSRYHAKGLSGDVDKIFIADEVTFNFAHISHKVNDVVSYDISHISKNANMEISGFLGANTLNQMTIHIDYRDGLVKFEYDPKRGYHF
jgi:predicted aspartyl protease